MAEAAPHRCWEVNRVDPVRGLLLVEVSDRVDAISVRRGDVRAGGMETAFPHVSAWRFESKPRN